MGAADAGADAEPGRDPEAREEKCPEEEGAPAPGGRDGERAVCICERESEDSADTAALPHDAQKRLPAAIGAPQPGQGARPPVGARPRVQD